MDLLVPLTTMNPKRQPLSQKNALRECTAPGCSKQFASTRKWAKFCSPACEQRARRAARKAQQQFAEAAE